MNNKLKNIFSIFLIVALCLHFCLITIYSSPYNVASEKINFVSEYYVYPYFQQHWQLFTPAPQIKYALYVRYRKNRIWTHWQNKLQEHINKHHRNIVLGNETNLLLYSGAINYVYYSLDTAKHCYTIDNKNKNVDVLKQAVKQQLLLEKKIFTEYEILLTATKKSNMESFYFKNLK